MFKYLKSSIFPSEISAGYTEINSELMLNSKFGLNFSLKDKKIYQESVQILANNLNFIPSDLVTVTQNHSDKIIIANKSNFDYLQYGADAVITSNPKLVLGVRTADCGNVLVYDSITKLRAVIHSGYKGAALNIVGKTIQKLVDLGSNPANLLCFIGPCIGQNALWVWQSTAKTWPEQFKLEFNSILNTDFENGKFIEFAHFEIKNYPLSELPAYLLDLNGYIEAQLLESGIRPNHIENTRLNSFEDQKFHSQRRCRLVDNQSEYGLGMGFIKFKI